MISWRLSLVEHLSSVSSSSSQHTRTPLALVPLFHARDVLMKSLAMYVADSDKIVREEIQVGV
jgi:hypothetical protein